MNSKKMKVFVTLSVLILSTFLPHSAEALVISYEVDLRNSNPNPEDPYNSHLYGSVTGINNTNVTIFLNSPQYAYTDYTDPLPANETIVYDIRFANNDYMQYVNPDRTFLQANFNGTYYGPDGDYSLDIDPYSGIETFYGSDGSDLFGPEAILTYPLPPYLPLGWIDDGGNCTPTATGLNECSAVDFSFDNGVSPLTDNVAEYFVPEVDVQDFLIYGFRLFVEPSQGFYNDGDLLISDFRWDVAGTLTLSDVVIGEQPPPAAPVPEPSTFLLLGSGLSGLAFVARRRKK